MLRNNFFQLNHFTTTAYQSPVVRPIGQRIKAKTQQYSERKKYVT